MAAFLSLAQIKTLPNIFSGVDLLTLSACNTATGGTGANGKEVEGFGVLAQRQGAKSVIASLWPVADSSTKVLMQEFYRLREVQYQHNQNRSLASGTTGTAARNKVTSDRIIIKRPSDCSRRSETGRCEPAAIQGRSESTVCPSLLLGAVYPDR